MQNRRKFIQGTAVATAAASTVPVAAMAESAVNNVGTRCIGQLSHADFAGLLNQTFRVRGEAGLGARVKLVEADSVKRIKDDHTGTEFESYDLVFSTPTGSDLPQGNYTLEHGRLGTLNAFVVPWNTERSDEGRPAVISVTRKV